MSKLLSKQARKAVIEQLVAYRMELAASDRATAELLADALQYGRKGYEEMDDNELLCESSEWIDNEQYEDGDAALS